jgi:solute carrier family 26 (sodium-independent sulfate anion transporter), member 11
METLKRWARRIVHAPEDPVPTVDSREWVKSHFDESPKDAVRCFSIQFTILLSFLQVVHYFKRLFPFIQWAPNYNVGWFVPANIPRYYI